MQCLFEAPGFFNQSVHSGLIRDVNRQFYFFLLFHTIIALLRRLPGALETRESQLPGTLDTGELLLFYLDLDIGPPWDNFKAINQISD